MDNSSPTELPPAKRQEPPKSETPKEHDNRPKQKELVTMDHFDTQMSEMETRLSRNITESVTAGLRVIIDTSVKEALEKIQKSVNDAIESNPTVKNHGEHLDSLETENLILKSKVKVMEGEQKKLQSKISKIEDRALQHCVIVRGIKEEEWEKENITQEKVYKELAVVVTMKSKEFGCRGRIPCTPPKSANVKPYDRIYFTGEI